MTMNCSKRCLFSLVLAAICADVTLSSARANEAGNVPLCFVEGTPWSEVVAAHADAHARGFTEVGRTRINSRIGSTAANPGGTSIGRGYTISWSYVPDGVTLPESSAVAGSAPSTLFATLNSQFPGGFEQWHSIFVEAFAQWAKVTGNRYIYEPNDDAAPFPTSGGVNGLRGDVRIGMRNIPGAVAAYNYLPSSGSDMVLDSLLLWSNTAFFKNIISHEHGHGMGLAHVCPVTRTKVMEPFASSTMPGPLLDDVIGGQRLYGDREQAFSSASSASSRNVRTLQLGVEPGALSDWFLIRGIGPVEFEVSPNGGSYLEGPQNADGTCQDGSPFDATSQSNLSIRIYAADGTTLLGSSDVGALGQAEKIRFRIPSVSRLAYARVDSSGAAYQLYQAKAKSTVLPLLIDVASAPTEIFANGFE